MKANIVTFTAILVLTALFLRQALGLAWTPVRIVGLAIAIPAVLLLLAARVQLGRAFSIRARASNLVTTGLYSRIRNPIYVFSSLFILGVIIWSGRPLLLLILVILIPIQIHRSTKEAAVLESKFGDEYREYKQKTWF